MPRKMGLSNGEKQTINILCLAEQILEHFVAMVGGRWVGKRFAAKCVSRENGKLLCGGRSEGRSEEYNPLQAAAHPSNS